MQQQELQQLQQDSSQQRQALLDLEAKLEEEMARKHKLVVELKKVICAHLLGRKASAGSL